MDAAGSAHVSRRLEDLYRRHRDGHADRVVRHYEPGFGYHLRDEAGRFARPEPTTFGLALASVDGDVIGVGDDDVAFPLQSLSKVFAYGMALQAHGAEHVITRVGVEPSGDSFSSLVFDERHGRPHNPMINAGALAVAELVADGDAPLDATARVLDALRTYAGNDDLAVDEEVAAAEIRTADRNRATAYLMRSEGMLHDDVEQTLAVYLRHCAVRVTCRDLAVMGATLANGGVNPVTGRRALATRHIRDVVSVMYTCGMYDGAGEWAYRVGIPAKSGVSGGTLAVVPGKVGIGVLSPGLDAHGNSVRGGAVCEEISERLGLHVFASEAEDTLLRAS